MCGIVGILSPRRRDAIYEMTEAVAHRGPDDVGYYQDEFIALGQRRLSIIDLKGGHQPLTNETGSIHLICNGEIYNSPQLRCELLQRGHTFKTETDVEVILHLYEDHGPDCVRHLRGMFAFAIWDERDKSLTLARDHLGQKQLYFMDTGDEFLFASEIKALLGTGLVAPEIDINGIWHYISLRFMPERYSLFKGIQKLPSATVLVRKNGTQSLQKYWDVDFRDKLPNDQKQVEDALDELLFETVKMHMLSDVRVGAFLSGGIDSSTVAAMMAIHSDEPVPVFSIGVHEHSFNELPYARQVSERYKMEAHERVVDANILDLLPTMVYHMEEPADPFGVGVYLASQIAGQSVKVVLGGDGGDENFAGYDRFSGQRLLDYYCLMPAWFRRTIMKRAIDLIPNTFTYKSTAQKASWMNELSFFPDGERYAESMSFLRFSAEAKQGLFTDTAKTQIEDDRSIEKFLSFFNAANANELVDRMLYTELMTRIPDHTNVIVDRMSMAHSLEVRSPLLDPKVVEFAASIPGNLKLKGNRLKYIFRQVAARYLPRELVTRRKQGFGFPLGVWMRTDWREFVTNLFAESRFVELGLFDPLYLKRLLNEHVSGRVDHSFRLWILINLEIWYRLYLEGETVDSMRSCIRRLAGSHATAAARSQQGSAVA